MNQINSEPDSIPARVIIAKDVLLSLEASKATEYPDLRKEAAKVLLEYLASK